MSHLDLELDIQRCIDGQMPEADQQALLRKLEGLPDGWRKLSLAFVENQVWSQVIEKGPVAAVKPADQPRPRKRAPLAMWGKVSASMAAGIVAGLMVHNQFAPQRGVPQMVAQADPDAPQRPVNVTSALSTVSNRVGQPEILSDQARRELLESGYVIDDGQLYYTIPTADGRYYIVPVKTVRVQSAVQ